MTAQHRCHPRTLAGQAVVGNAVAGHVTLALILWGLGGSCAASTTISDAAPLASQAPAGGFRVRVLEKAILPAPADGVPSPGVSARIVIEAIDAAGQPTSAFSGQVRISATSGVLIPRPTPGGGAGATAEIVADTESLLMPGPDPDPTLTCVAGSVDPRCTCTTPERRANEHCAVRPRFVAPLAEGRSPELAVEIRYPFEPPRIYVEELVAHRDPVHCRTPTLPGNCPERHTEGPGFGMSPPLGPGSPTIETFQRALDTTFDGTDRAEQDRQRRLGDVFLGRRAVLTGGELVVTGTDGRGFYVTDVAGCPEGAGRRLCDSRRQYKGLYVFTIFAPTVDVGNRLRYISGTVADFSGLGQLAGNVAYERESFAVSLPAAIELQADDLCDGRRRLEPFESDRVRLGTELNATAGPLSAAEREAYLQYQQWPVTLPGACPNGAAPRILVLAAGDLLPRDFDPLAIREGQRFSVNVSGNLRHNFVAGYGIVPSRPTDLSIIPR